MPPPSPPRPGSPAGPGSFWIHVDGRPVPARAGQTVAGALVAAGIRTFRHGEKGEPRGLFCGMGVCFECRVTVDGVPDVRACVTPARPGCRVELEGPGGGAPEGAEGAGRAAG
ncbi:MAG: hypothetical protein Kow0092_35930 [Deferrisomatales bacterium]